jgi:hypothetical protein
MVARTSTTKRKGAHMGFMDKLKGAAESVQAQTSKVGIGASGDQMALANKAKRLMDAGVDTPGHIDSMEPTGNTDTPGGAENVITVTVKPVGGEAYQATFNQYVYPSAPFAAGEDVNVKVDPDDPNVVMIWGKA